MESIKTGIDFAVAEEKRCQCSLSYSLGNEGNPRRL